MNIEVVWGKLKQFEGEEFYTKTGKPFVYKFSDNSLIIDRKNAKTTETYLKKALSIKKPELSDL